MAGFFGALGSAIKQGAQEEFNQNPFVQRILALKQRRQVPRDPVGAQTGVFAPGVFGTPGQIETPEAGMTGPFGPVY